MVEQSNLVIAFVEREKGGAYEAVKYAKKLKKSIINICNISSDKNED